MLKFIFCVLVLSFELFAMENYEVFIKQYQTTHDENFITLRKFTDKGEVYYLLLNTQTFQTTLTTLDATKLTPLDDSFQKTRFAQTLYLATSMPQGGGIGEKTSSLKNAIFLTMDMCPSLNKDYERTFLTSLINQNGKTPLAIAITSRWIEMHEETFSNLANNPHLEITWVNHTQTHFYDPHLPNEKNFMLHVKTNVQREILELEKSLIKRGITPSVFFRFPGLIADEKLMRELRETYFLIPIGSHTWIAKNQKIKNGSIILVHGNKNEHKGIEMLEKQLPSLIKKYTFKPLHEAF